MANFIKKLLSKIILYVIIVLLFLFGDVAQLARASGSYPEGRGFDPLRRYQMFITRYMLCLVFILEKMIKFEGAKI